MSVAEAHRRGPFAWQGLISFWAVFVMFCVLIAVVTPYAWKALRRLEVEDLAAATP
jgi:cbb3-type cytochrome oxidase subunit 3